MSADTVRRRLFLIDIDTLVLYNYNTTVSVETNRKKVICIMENKRPSYTRPWFWLLIIFLLSAFVKLAPKEDILPGSAEPQLPESKLPVENIGIPDTAAPDSDTDTPESHLESETKEKSKFHFILNASTKKYHITECSGVKKLSESKRTDTDIEAYTLDEARAVIESEGYELCGFCAKQVQE